MKKRYMDELDNFMERVITKGLTKAKIIKMLVSQGWPEKFVNR